MKLVSFVFIVLWLSGCSLSYTSNILNTQLSEVGLKDIHQYERMADWRLNRASKIGLKLADPDNVLLPRTTKQLNRLLIAEFDSRFGEYQVINSNSVTQGLAESFENGCELLFVATLIDAKNKLNTRQEISLGRTHYPEREWGRDQLALQVRIYETQSRQLLDQITLTSEAAYFKRNDTIALNLIEGSLKNLFDDLTATKRNS